MSDNETDDAGTTLADRVLARFVSPIALFHFFALRRRAQPEDSWTISRPSRLSLTGALLFIDITGYTTLCDRLYSEEGSRSGAERLTKILNECFSVVIDLVEQHGGFVERFVGDALIVVFPVFDESWLSDVLLPSTSEFCKTVEQCIMDAVRCAVDASAAFLTLTERYGISLHIGLSFDKFDSILCGGTNTVDAAEESFLPWRHFLFGVSWNLISNAVKASTEGQVVATSKLFPLLLSHPDVSVKMIGNVGDDEYAVLSLVLPSASADEMHPSRQSASLIKSFEDRLRMAMSPHLLRSTVLRPMIEPFLFDRVLLLDQSLRAPSDSDSDTSSGSGPAVFALSDLRSISVIFVRLVLESKPHGTIEESLHEVISSAATIVAENEAWLANSLFDEKGLVLVVAFGVPHSHLDDKVRSAVCAVRLLSALSSVCTSEGQTSPFVIDAAMGIVSGVVFSGLIGDLNIRADMTVIGDAVNIAARLACALPDSILASDTCLPVLGDGSLRSRSLSNLVDEGIEKHLSSARRILCDPMTQEALSCSRYSTIVHTIGPLQAVVRGKRTVISCFLLGARFRPSSAGGRDRRLSQAAYKGRMIGRLAELRQIDDWCQQNDPLSSMMLLEAEYGMGKSVLLEEFLRRRLGISLRLSDFIMSSRHEDTFAFYTQALEFNVDDAYSVIKPLFDCLLTEIISWYDRYVAQGRKVTDRSLCQFLKSAVALRGTDVEFLSTFSLKDTGESFLGSALSSNLKRWPDFLRNRIIYQFLLDMIVFYARRIASSTQDAKEKQCDVCRPVKFLFIVDDAHFCDEASGRVLTMLAGQSRASSSVPNVPSSSVAFKAVMSYRGPLNQGVFASLLQRKDVTQVRLPPLSKLECRASVLAFFEDFGVVDISHDVLEYVYEKSLHGIPLFVAEWARVLHHETFHAASRKVDSSPSATCTVDMEARQQSLLRVDRGILVWNAHAPVSIDDLFIGSKALFQDFSQSSLARAFLQFKWDHLPIVSQLVAKVAALLGSQFCSLPLLIVSTSVLRDVPVARALELICESSGVDDAVRDTLQSFLDIGWIQRTLSTSSSRLIDQAEPPSRPLEVVSTTSQVSPALVPTGQFASVPLLLKAVVQSIAGGPGHCYAFVGHELRSVIIYQMLQTHRQKIHSAIADLLMSAVLDYPEFVGSPHDAVVFLSRCEKYPLDVCRDVLSSCLSVSGWRNSDNAQGFPVAAGLKVASDWLYLLQRLSFHLFHVAIPQDLDTPRELRKPKLLLTAALLAGVGLGVLQMGSVEKAEESLYRCAEVLAALYLLADDNAEQLTLMDLLVDTHLAIGLLRSRMQAQGSPDAEESFYESLRCAVQLSLLALDSTTSSSGMPSPGFGPVEIAGFLHKVENLCDSRVFVIVWNLWHQNLSFSNFDTGILYCFFLEKFVRMVSSKKEQLRPLPGSSGDFDFEIMSIGARCVLLRTIFALGAPSAIIYGYSDATFSSNSHRVDASSSLRPFYVVDSLLISSFTVPPAVRLTTVLMFGFEDVIICGPAFALRFAWSLGFFDRALLYLRFIDALLQLSTVKVDRSSKLAATLYRCYFFAIRGDCYDLLTLAAQEGIALSELAEQSIYLNAFKVYDAVARFYSALDPDSRNSMADAAVSALQELSHFGPANAIKLLMVAQVLTHQDVVTEERLSRAWEILTTLMLRQRIIVTPSSRAEYLEGLLSDDEESQRVWEWRYPSFGSLAPKFLFALGHSLLLARHNGWCQDVISAEVQLVSVGVSLSALKLLRLSVIAALQECQFTFAIACASQILDVLQAGLDLGDGAEQLLPWCRTVILRSEEEVARIAIQDAPHLEGIKEEMEKLTGCPLPGCCITACKQLLQAADAVLDSNA